MEGNQRKTPARGIWREEMNNWDMSIKKHLKIICVELVILIWIMGGMCLDILFFGSNHFPLFDWNGFWFVIEVAIIFILFWIIATILEYSHRIVGIDPFWRRNR